LDVPETHIPPGPEAVRRVPDRFAVRAEARRRVPSAREVGDADRPAAVDRDHEDIGARFAVHPSVLGRVRDVRAVRMPGYGVVLPRTEGKALLIGAVPVGYI